MDKPPPSRSPARPGPDKAKRLEREAAALRENLRKRKEQARAREPERKGPGQD